MPRTDLRSLSRDEITQITDNMGLPKFRATQLYEGIQAGADTFGDLTTLPKALREELEKNYFISDVKVKRRLQSKLDGTVKYLYELYDGNTVESVFMVYRHGCSVCVSTQVGCRMGCKFCASGQNGLIRNLLPGEILAQIRYAAKDNNTRISNVVLMGMGEPLDNFDNIVKFLHLAGEPKGLNIGMRHISVSTSGLVNRIKELQNLDIPVTLSVSLHAPDDEIRDTIMPVNKKWNVDTLLAACNSYANHTKRRISYEYALISGKNDMPECAEKLAKKLKGQLCHVNLIPVNEVKENSFKKPDKKQIELFKSILEQRGITTTVRRTLGSDINASCGQLRSEDIREWRDRE